MSDGSSSPEVPKTALDSLTEEQKKLLSQTLESIKQDIVSDATIRLKRQFLTGGLLAAVIALISFFGVKNTIQGAAVATLTQDAALREQIRKTASSRIDDADEILEDLRQTAEKLERERSEGNVILNRSIKDLNDLIDSLKKSYGKQQ